MKKQPKTAVDAKSQENLLVPKLWHGMTVSVWWRLLRSNHFDVSLSRLPTALMITLFSLNNSALGFVQRLIYDRQIKHTKIESGPIFVVGHYRSGTTMLQELLCSDPRFTFPTTYECFSPHHFLVTERLFAWWLKLILPAQRLADRMLQGPDRPQEDEAAMCCFGLPSRFHRFAFPNRQHGDQVNPNLDLLTARQRQDWKETFEYFLKAVTLRRPLPIVLKSPQHTCRIRHLADSFDGRGRC